MTTTKKEYTTPQLVVHGDVETITQVNGFVHPTDVKNGRPGEAFPLS